MLNRLTWYIYWFKYLIRTKINSKSEIHNKFTKHDFFSPKITNDFIKNKVHSGDPFMACRIGANESFTLRTFEFEHKKNYSKALNQLCLCAGFFPNDINSAHKFLTIMKASMHSMDLCGSLLCPLDDFFITHFAPSDCKICLLDSIDSTDRNKPWTAQLKGKRVLVVHPFAKTIEMQYQKRELLYPQRDVLPIFELITFQSVQTSAGQTDGRFSSWFEALDYMTAEIANINFDIALLGCGSYGLPLAARIKDMGRQAVQIGGSLQILFGIKGKRWDNDPGTTKFYNDAWVYPLDEETPIGAIQVENACYWK